MTRMESALEITPSIGRDLPNFGQPNSIKNNAPPPPREYRNSKKKKINFDKPFFNVRISVYVRIEDVFSGKFQVFKSDRLGSAMIKQSRYVIL